MTRALTPATDPNRARAGLPVRAVVFTASVALVVVLWALHDATGRLVGLVAAAAFVLDWLGEAAWCRARHARVLARHDGDDVVEVRSTAALREILTADDVDGPIALSRFWTTGFSLVLTDAGFELWRGGARPRSAAALPWSRVDDVGLGVVGKWEQPVVDVRLRGDREVTIAPARRLGSRLTGSRDAANLLVAAMRARLEASRPIR